MTSFPPAFLKRPSVLAFLFCLIGGGLVYWYGFAPNSPPTPSKAKFEDLETPPVANPGYLGAESCRECHATRFDDYKSTRHYVACIPPTEMPMPDGFLPNRGKHTPIDGGPRFEMLRRENTYLIKTTHPETSEKETISPIGLTFGQGGKWDEVYFTWRRHELFELPVVWLHPTKEWANTSFDRSGGGDFSRATTTRCMECHTTWMAHTPGTSNEYRPDTVILRVGCERCHGPGRDHVAFHRANPKETGSHEIVHPSHLERERKIEVCTQCHGNGALPRGLAFTYRPGLPLEEYVRTLTSRTREDDHVANQIHYLRQSKCFQKTDMTCLTCHDPHRPNDHASFERACARCHQPADCREQPKLPEELRNDCNACHMPPRVWMNVHFHTATERFKPPIRRFDHRIGIYPEGRDEVLFRHFSQRPEPTSKAEAERLKKNLVEFWTKRADREKEANHSYLEMAAIREAIRIDPTQELQSRLKDANQRQKTVDDLTSAGMRAVEKKSFPEAIASFQKVLELKPNAAKVKGKLGFLYAMTNRMDQAKSLLAQVEVDDPNDPYGLNLLGWLAYLDNRSSEAMDLFRRAAVIDPGSIEIAYRLGLSELNAGQGAAAIDSFRRVLVLSPDHAGAHQGLSHALRSFGELPKAVLHARRAAKLTGEKNADVLLSLANAYADAGYRVEAVDATRKALDVATASEPGLVAPLQRLLRQLTAEENATHR